MIAPPPMPNRPARMPVTTPPATITAASKRELAEREPKHGCSEDAGSSRRDACRGGLRHFSGLSITSAKRLRQHLGACAGLDRLRREMPAEGARARHAVEQAEHMARDGMQPRAARELALDVGQKRLRGSLVRLRTARARRRAADRPASSRHGS